VKFLFLLLLVIAGGFVFSNAFAEEYPQLVSISIDGEPGNGGSYQTTISSNGQFVVFMSEASNLVESDRNHQQDVFVRDLINKKTYLVSVASDGTQGSQESGHPSISSDGKKIVFHTGNVFGSDVQNEGGGIYLHDLDSRKTTWISKPVTNLDEDGNEIVYGGGGHNPVISGDGKFVFFLAEPNDLGLEGTGNLIVYDVNSKSISAVELNVESGWPGYAVSDNGKKIVFANRGEIDSFPDSDKGDLFVYDRDSEEFTWITQPIDEFKIPSDNRRVSIDSVGRYVAFQSSAPNLVEVDTNDDESFFLHDLQTSQTKLISITPSGTQFFANSWIDISGNGKFVLFQDGGMLVYDVELEKTIQLTADGIDSSGIDFNGEFISFISRNNNHQIFVSTNPPPDNIPQDQLEPGIDEEGNPVPIVCEEEICVDDCNEMANCRVEWMPEPITSESKLTKLKLESIESILIKSNNSNILIAKTIASNDGDEIIYGHYVPYLFTGNSSYEQKRGYDVSGYGIKPNLCDTVNPDIFPGTNVELNTCFILPSDDLSNFSLRIFESRQIDSFTDEIFKNSSEEIPLKTPSIEYGVASFVDQTKDPQHYVERYTTEPSYKEWFDSNFPDYTIYEGIGITEDEYLTILSSLEESSVESMETNELEKPVVTNTLENIGEIKIETTIQDDEPSCGAGTMEKDGICVVDTTKSTEEKSSGGGCLIATATYGSELAPQVQQLREIRDNSLLQTASGTSFMDIFNDFYYSFSPIIADYERENPMFREMVKIAITPMVSSLSILNYVDMDSEESVLGYGISLILLNVGMYFALPAIVIVGIKRKI